MLEDKSKRVAVAGSCGLLLEPGIRQGGLKVAARLLRHHSHRPCLDVATLRVEGRHGKVDDAGDPLVCVSPDGGRAGRGKSLCATPTAKTFFPPAQPGVFISAEYRLHPVQEVPLPRSQVYSQAVSSTHFLIFA